MDVIASVNSLYEVPIIDVAVLCENAHLKHFVFGDTTGPAKVSRVHCRCRKKAVLAETNYGTFLFLLGPIYGQNTSEINFSTCAIDRRFRSIFVGIHS